MTVSDFHYLITLLSILTQFLWNRSQHVMMDGCLSKLVNVVSGVPQGSVWCPLLFILYTSKLFSILENKLIDNADDSTLMVMVTYPGVRVTVAESLIPDLGRVSEWWELWGMKLNASKPKNIIVSRSCAMYPQSPTLTIGGTVLKESGDLVILGVTFDTKMTFEKHLRPVSRLSLLLLLLLKKIGNARPGEGDWHPISQKTPAPHYQPIEEKEEKGKIVEDKKGGSN